MRKVTMLTCGAFENRQKCTSGNTYTDGNALYLHGNKIAEWRDGELWISNAGWSSVTTKERLNGLRGVSIYQKDYTWFLNGVEWSGEWVQVSKHVQPPKSHKPTIAIVDGVEYTPATVDGVEWCKGCGHKMPEHPALSRYNHGEICSDCGLREALQGDFIASKVQA